MLFHRLIIIELERFHIPSVDLSESLLFAARSIEYSFVPEPYSIKHVRCRSESRDCQQRVAAPRPRKDDCPAVACEDVSIQPDRDLYVAWP